MRKFFKSYAEVSVVPVKAPTGGARCAYAREPPEGVLARAHGHFKGFPRKWYASRPAPMG